MRENSKNFKINFMVHIIFSAEGEESISLIGQIGRAYQFLEHPQGVSRIRRIEKLGECV